MKKKKLGREICRFRTIWSGRLIRKSLRKVRKESIWRKINWRLLMKWQHFSNKNLYYPSGTTGNSCKANLCLNRVLLIFRVKTRCLNRLCMEEKVELRIIMNYCKIAVRILTISLNRLLNNLKKQIKERGRTRSWTISIQVHLINN